MRFRAVSFDADGTLFDFDRAMLNGLAAVVRAVKTRHPSTRDSPTVKRLRAIRDTIAAAQPSAPQATIRRESFRRALAEVNIDDPALLDEITTEYFHHRHTCITLYPDAERALQELNGYAKLGIISNGNSFAADCGLSFSFDFEIYSERAGRSKPNPAIFRLAAAAAGCGISELLHVGDSLIDDVVGARDAGCGAVWLQRRPNREPAPPDVLVIDSLDHLRQHLA